MTYSPIHQSTYIVYPVFYAQYSFCYLFYEPFYEMLAYFQKNLRETAFFVRIAYFVYGMSPVDAGCTEGNDK